MAEAEEEAELEQAARAGPEPRQLEALEVGDGGKTKEI